MTTPGQQPCPIMLGTTGLDPNDGRRAFTVAQFVDEVDAYIRWYNETRIKMSLGGKSPIEYRKNLGLMP